jgi:DNA gyrase subunit A
VYALLEGADRSDRVVSMIPVDELEMEERYLLFLSRGGLVKRTELAEFANPRAGGVIAAGVRDGDAIVDVVLSDGTGEVMLLNGAGRAIRFPEGEVSVVGRTAQGVKGMELAEDDRVVGMLLIRRDATVLTVTDGAQGKRTPVGEFPLQKRGGKGTLALPSGGDGGALVAALEVLEADEVMLISAGGTVTRVRADTIPVQGRRTRGRKLLTLPAGDRVVEVTRTQGGGGAPEPAGGVAAVADDEDGRDQLDLLGG